MAHTISQHEGGEQGEAYRNYEAKLAEKDKHLSTLRRSLRKAFNPWGNRVARERGGRSCYDVPRRELAAWLEYILKCMIGHELWAANEDEMSS